MNKVESLKVSFQILSYPYFFSFMIVITCYIKSLQTLKKCPAEIKLEMESTIKKVYVYPFAQLLLMFPLTAYTTFSWIVEVEDSALILDLLMVPIFMFGFATAFLCYKQQRSSVNLVKSTMIIQDLNQSEDYMTDSQISFEYREI